MIEEKKIGVEEVKLTARKPLPPAPPPSQKFFDGFAAALWGTILGGAVSAIFVVTVVLHYGGSPMQVYTALAVTTFLTIAGCLVHLTYKEQYHVVISTRHFFNIVLLGFILGLLMVVILPGLLVALFLWIKFRSVQDESEVLKARLTSPLMMSRMSSRDNHAACH